MEKEMKEKEKEQGNEEQKGKQERGIGIVIGIGTWDLNLDLATTMTTTLDIPPPFQPFAPRKKTRREAQDPHLDLMSLSPSHFPRSPNFQLSPPVFPPCPPCRFPSFRVSTFPWASLGPLGPPGPP